MITTTALRLSCHKQRSLRKLSTKKEENARSALINPKKIRTGSKGLSKNTSNFKKKKPFCLKQSKKKDSSSKLSASLEENTRNNKCNLPKKYLYLSLKMPKGNCWVLKRFCMRSGITTMSRNCWKRDSLNWKKPRISSTSFNLQSQRLCKVNFWNMRHS